MKTKFFIILILSHLLFFLCTFLVYFSQYYLDNDFLTYDIAHGYAMTLFLPNIIVLVGSYVFYINKFIKKFKEDEVDNLKLHVLYNLFFLFGFVVMILNTQNTFFCDSVFIICEALAAILSFLLIYKIKNKKGYAKRIF